MVPDSVGLEKMLSISVLEYSVTLVGNKICGSIRFEPRVSKKELTSGSESHFKRSMLKSPSRIISFLSEITLCKSGLRKSELNELVVKLWCL